MELVTLFTLVCCLVVGLMMGLLAYMKHWLGRQAQAVPVNTPRQLFYLNLAIAVFLVGSGVLADTYGVWPILVAGCVLIALSLVTLSATGPGAVGPYAVLGAALGACMLYVCTILLLPHGVFGEHEVMSSLTLGLVFVSLAGLLLAPLFDVLSGLIGYRMVLAVLAVLALAPVWLSLGSDSTHFLPSSRPALLRLTADPSLWLAGLVFLLYAPLEGFIGVWASGYCASHEETLGSDVFWLALFWAFFCTSRVLFGLLLHIFGSWADYYQTVSLIVPIILSAVCLGNMIGSARPAQALAGLIGLGFCMGPILPVLLTIVIKMPMTQHGPATALGLLFGCGAVGSLALSPLARWSTQAQNARSGLIIPLMLSLALGTVALFFALMVKN